VSRSPHKRRAPFPLSRQRSGARARQHLAEGSARDARSVFLLRGHFRRRTSARGGRAVPAAPLRLPPGSPCRPSAPTDPRGARAPGDGCEKGWRLRERSPHRPSGRGAEGGVTWRLRSAGQPRAAAAAPCPAPGAAPPPHSAMAAALRAARSARSHQVRGAAARPAAGAERRSRGGRASPAPSVSGCPSLPPSGRRGSCNWLSSSECACLGFGYLIFSFSFLFFPFLLFIYLFINFYLPQPKKACLGASPPYHSRAAPAQAQPIPAGCETEGGGGGRGAATRGRGRGRWGMARGAEDSRHRPEAAQLRPRAGAWLEHRCKSPRPPPPELLAVP